MTATVLLPRPEERQSLQGEQGRDDQGKDLCRDAPFRRLTQGEILKGVRDGKEEQQQRQNYRSLDPRR